MKTLWIVISGSDFIDGQYVEGCFESVENAKKKVDELKAKITGEWVNDYFISETKGQVILPHQWSNRSDYIKIEENDLLP